VDPPDAVVPPAPVVTDPPSPLPTAAPPLPVSPPEPLVLPPLPVPGEPPAPVPELVRPGAHPPRKATVDRIKAQGVNGKVRVMAVPVAGPGFCVRN